MTRMASALEMLIYLLIASFISFFPPTAMAQGAGEEINRLIKARSLKCTVGPGYSTDWKSGRPRPERADWKKGNVFHYDSIDLKNRKARIIGNKGAADLFAMATARGIHFVETTPSGNMVFSTVFYHRATKGFAFVTSRHIDFGMGFGGPLPSQVNGTCKIFD